MLLNVVQSGGHIMPFCTCLIWCTGGDRLIFLGSSCLQVADWYKLLLPYWSMHNAHLLLAVAEAFPSMQFRLQVIFSPKPSGFIYSENDEKCFLVSFSVLVVRKWVFEFRFSCMVSACQDSFVLSIAYGLNKCIHLVISLLVVFLLLCINCRMFIVQGSFVSSLQTVGQWVHYIFLSYMSTRNFCR